MLFKSLRKKIIQYIIIFAVIVSGSLNFLDVKVKAAENVPNVNAEEQTLTGYLIDEHCFVKKGDDPGGKDTKMCLLMNGCIKGGYGIAVPQSDGSYQFYYFDGDFFTDVTTLNGTGGQKLGYDIVKATDRYNHVSVTVKGTFYGTTKPSTKEGNTSNYPVFNVKSIAETEKQTLTGYLIDEHCFAMKSADPGKDTKHCLLMDNCIKGGYGIAIPQKDGNFKFYYFDGNFFTNVETLDGTAAQKLAYDIAKATEKNDHIAVTATGSFAGVTKASTRLEGGSYPVFDIIQLLEATDADREQLINFKKDPVKVETTDSTTGISIKVGDGVLLTGTTLSTNIITSGANFELAQTALKDVASKSTLFDISLLASNVKVQPLNGNTVEVSIPIPAGYDTKKIELYRINDDGSKTLISGNIVDGKFVFSTDHFSLYAIVEKVTTNGEGMSTESTSIIKTGDTNIITPILVMIFLFGITAIAIVRRKKIVK